MIPQISIGASLVIRLGLGLGFLASVMAFDMTRNTNLAVYWGQDSYGMPNPNNPATWQHPIDYYCGDDTIDTLPIAFLTEFYSIGNLPTINLANTCNTVNFTTIPGTNLPNCTFLAAGIETCQNAGKIVTLSIGGASGAVGFTSDAQGQAYAKVIWETFLGGNSSTRPFGAAVLDGIDMDVEGGPQTGFTAFLTALRSLMDSGNKKYYITAAPQCPFPDAYIGTTLDTFAFDAIYVQFYDSPCELNNFASGNEWDFGRWDTWAKTVSPNKNVKVYIGAAASSTAARSGYVSGSALGTIISQTKSQYASFGGVMLWDASQAYANGRYDQVVKSLLNGPVDRPLRRRPWGAFDDYDQLPVGMDTTSLVTMTATPTTTPSTSPTGSTTTTLRSNPTPSETPSAGRCAGIPAWKSNAVYLGGDNVTYTYDLWTATTWNQGATPGGSAGVWTLVGSC